MINYKEIWERNSLNENFWVEVLCNKNIKELKFGEDGLVSLLLDHGEEIFINGCLFVKEKYSISEKGYLPEREREIETIFSMGNGYVGTRNSLEEPYPQSTPGSFLAGFYEKSIDDTCYDRFIWLVC